jgi:hypothetical protein
MVLLISNRAFRRSSSLRGCFFREPVFCLNSYALLRSVFLVTHKAA